MKNQVGSAIIGIVVALLIAGALLPIGLDFLLSATLPETIDPALEDLILIVIHVFAVIAIVMGFIQYIKD